MLFKPRTRKMAAGNSVSAAVRSPPRTSQLLFSPRKRYLMRSVAIATLCSLALSTRVIPPDDAAPLLKFQADGISETYYSLAQQLSQVGGQASLGWLFLLAALEFSPTNATYIDPIVNSYARSQDYALALSHLLRAQDALKSSGSTTGLSMLKSYLASLDVVEEVKALREVADSPDPPPDNLPPPKLTLPFSTAIARWDCYHQYENLKEEILVFYDAVIRGYHIFKGEKKAGSGDTKLNHDFYDWQMKPLKDTGKYWSGFEELPVFHQIQRIFRAAAYRYLRTVGISHRDAMLKSQSRTVVWASVHTGRSHHGPHNTEDSMVGGVFYVKVPKKAGSLLFSDPRGKNSVMQAPASVPTAPFHKLFQVDPYEGLLILFPGWLVHQVAHSPGLDPSEDGYRVSISFNLNGEWAETVPAIFDEVEVDSSVHDYNVHDEL